MVSLFPTATSLSLLTSAPGGGRWRQPIRAPYLESPHYAAGWELKTENWSLRVERTGREMETLRARTHRWQNACCICCVAARHAACCVASIVCGFSVFRGYFFLSAFALGISIFSVFSFLEWTGLNSKGLLDLMLSWKHFVQLYKQYVYRTHTSLSVQLLPGILYLIIFNLPLRTHRIIL